MGQLPPIAIVGVSCRMPGGDGIADYWKLIESGSSAIGQLPDERLNRSLYFDAEQGKVGRSYTELGGIVPDRPVNRSVCPISDELLAKSDVAHLNLCEVASAALQHAGMDPKNVPYARTGVFVGHSGGSCLGGDAAFARYAGVTGELLKSHEEFKGCSPAARADLARRMVERLRSQLPEEKTVKPMNFAAANAAMLISRVHGFEGPSLVIDAACASSLMALSQAAQSLARGEIDMAVAGGASYSKWFGLVLFSMAMSISPTGSRPFDSDADGLISSDGYGIVILKTLSRAIADGDRILSVIRGIGVSSDGRGKSLWAPRPEGQMLAVERAYSKDVTPASLQYIECHATSTQVGDATELKTLSHVFASMIPAGRKIPIGSVKANIGHTLEAAGIAGLIKTVLAMDKGVIPPQINFKTPNPQIDWDNIPFEVATQSRQWDRPGNGMPRRAAVNSFGIGGLNVHMVLDDGLLPGESGKTQVSIPSKVSGVVSRSSKSAQTKQQPIAIIGTSAILPGALTKAAMWEVLVSGKDPKCEFPKSRCSEANVLLAEQQAAQNPEQTTRGGYISDFVYDWKRHKVPPKQIANANPLQFMLLDAADQALEDAGYGKRTFDRTKAAVVVGTMFGGDFAVQLQLGLRVPHIQQMLRELLLEDGAAPDAVEEAVAQFEKRLFKVMPALLDETGSFTSSTLASRLSKSFDFCGGAFSIESDEVSGLVAVNAGIGMLDTGAADMVLCAAGHQSMSYNSFETLLESDLLSRGDSRSGFDTAFDGVLPAEGVAVVVLKRLADAERDGDPIRAIIRGTAQCTRKGDESATLQRAFREACEVAATTPKNIGLLESAGIESQARVPDNSSIVQNVQTASGEQGVRVSSLTPQFGYLRGASGVASIVKAVLQIEHAKIPPVFGLQQLSETAQPVASAIPRETQPLFATMPDGRAQIAVNNTSEEGFGFSVILESRAELPKKPVTKAPGVASRPAAVPTRPKVASAGVSTTRAVRDRLALAFPGQGSYYAGMGSQLLEDYPVARERLAEFNRALRLEGCPEFETLAADPGSSILNAQLSMLVIDLLYYAVYQTSGVKPDFVCGHSYGEFPALVAAGALTFQHAVRATKQRSAVVEEFGGKQGGLLAISSDAATIRQLLTRSTIEVFLANINSPEQTVVGGTPEDLRQFEQMLKAKRIGSRMLKVPAAYHTPLLEPALATYRDCIRDLPITPPHIPVISGIGNCLVLDPEVIRENLVMQLVSPMDFVGMIEVLQQQKVGTVVEVGPRKVLAQLIQKTVSETDLRCLPMDPRDASSPEWSSTLLATRKAVETASPKPLAPTIPPRTKTPVAQAVTAIPPTAKDAGSVVTEKSRIIHFDATARRKEQNRERALKQRAEAGKPEIGVAAPQAASAPVPERNGHAASNGHAANGRAEANGWHAPPAPTPAAEPVVAPVAEPVVAVVEAPAAPRVLPNRAELQAFVIEYIVDQTGYPAEMVEMEADLEADLGIDSIKKAQMMGECAQKFELHWLANEVADLSLDQFPTLESIVKFLTEDAAKAASEPAPQAVPAVTAPAAPSMPAPVSVPVVKAQPAVAPAAPPVVAAAVEAVVEAPAAPRVLPNRAELQAFVIEYIVDQTGYPAEMVEMEADLEADLGIDSIKKAQMMGECAQKFELHWLANEVADLSLDQFPTLESIVKFLTEDAAKATKESTAEVAHEVAPSVKPTFEPASPSMNGSHASPAVDLAPATAASSTAVLDWEPAIGKGLVTQVVLSGDAYQIGLQHGRQEREAIHAILERQISRYGSRLDNMPELDQALMDPGRYFGEEEVAELQGIADGAELPVGFLVGHNLGLCEDYVPGCVHFAITSGVNGRHGLIHAANEDSSLALSLTDSLKRIVQYRAPAKGYRHVAFSVTGQLCGINGTNEKGLTVSSTLLLDRAPRDVTAPGDIHPVLIKRILENAATPEEAVEILKGSKRNGAWGICISHSATDSLSYVEYDSDQIEVRTGMTRVVGTNHSLLLGATHPTPPHSIHRMERLNELLNSHEAEGVTSQIAEASLRDQFDGRRQRVTAHPTMNTICRVDNQISVVMSPARQVIRVTPGPAKKEIAHEFSTLTVEEFFRNGSKKNDPAASSSVGEGSGVDSARVASKTNRFDGLPAASDRVMRRVVLRPRQESLPNPGTAAFALTGRSLVYGTGEVAETLVARLRESGLTAELLNVCDDMAALEADFEKLIASQPVDHLFVVGPKTLEEVASGKASDRFVSTFRICQLWTQWAAKCGNLATCTMTAITFMGGNFGLNGSPSGADGGALTGLWKALRRELGVVPARVIDFSGDESAIRVVEQLQSELAHPFQTCEVAYSRGERFVLSARPVPSSPQNDFGPTPGTAWIVTGGARGVTAVVARELGLRCGVHLHLIGSSPLAQVDPALMDATAEELKPLRRQLMSEARERGEVPLDAWNAFERGLEINRTLREMAQAGVSVTYHACDVSDAAAVQKTISAIRSLNVPIEGVIHGAGVENACRFDRKQLPKVRKTFDVKVDGAKNLAMALEHDPVVFFVGFGSTSGRFGGLGQADYSAASDSLAKFCNELGRKRPDCRTITVHWPPWGEVGMAARPESKLALEAGGMAFMPPREGVAFLLEELCSAAPEPEILIADKPDGLDLDKTLPARAEWDDYAAAQGRIESSPLLETVVEFERGRSVKVEARFNPATDPFLYDHQHKNAPILPMAFGMETLAETLKVLVPELTSLTISNTEIVNGMRFFADRPEVVTARVEKVGDHYVGELVAKFLNRKGVLLQNERVLVKAELRPVTAAGSRAMPVPSTAASETVEYAETWEQIGEPRFGSVFTGPTIRGVTEISRESDSFSGTIVPPSTAGFAGSRPTTGWLTSPAVLDACFIGCDRWTSLTLGRLHLPQTFDEVQFHQVVPDGQPCRLFGQVLEVGDNQIRYDFSLWNASGQALIEARGFQVVSASTAQVVSTPPQASPAPVEKVEAPVATQTVNQESATPQLLFPLEAITSSADLWEAEVRIEPLTEPLLNGHRFNNSPLLPGVAMVELFTEALREVCPGNDAPRVRNFQIHHSLHLKAALPRRVQVVAQRSSDGFDCRLVDLDGGNILLATAKIDRVPVSPESLPKLDKPKGQFGPMKYPDVGPLIHGAPLRSLHALCSGRDDAWAEILPTEITTLLGKGSTCQPMLHPAVLDASFFACGVHAWMNCFGRVELPLGFEELLVLRREPLRKGEKLMARLKYRDSDDSGSTYDLTLFDKDKQPVYIIKGYRSVAKGIVTL